MNWYYHLTDSPNTNKYYEITFDIKVEIHCGYCSETEYHNETYDSIDEEEYELETKTEIRYIDYELCSAKDIIKYNQFTDTHNYDTDHCSCCNGNNAYYKVKSFMLVDK